MTTDDPTPTTRWLATVPDMPPLQGPAGAAERLLLLLHYGIDWNHGWVSRYRSSYWDQLLPDRIIVATFRSANLRQWWATVAGDLESTPRNGAERRELEQLLRADPIPVLQTLRTETSPLLLRCRIVAEAVRATPTPAASAAEPATPKRASSTPAKPGRGRRKEPTP